MREYGRIAVCGSISMYNDTTPQKGPYVHTHMIFKQLRMEGFLCGRWKHKHQQSLRRLMAWMTEPDDDDEEEYDSDDGGDDDDDEDDDGDDSNDDADDEEENKMFVLILQGKLRCNEHITSGFNNMPAAFMGMLQGDNIGKAVVKV
ncbi:unnamed protein product [Coregonus sp. 'balchen']|nr:unnamed protein product [Coregonus sp. 'balchen']